MSQSAIGIRGREQPPLLSDHFEASSLATAIQHPRLTVSSAEAIDRGLSNHFMMLARSSLRATRALAVSKNGATKVTSVRSRNHATVVVARYSQDRHRHGSDEYGAVVCPS